MPPLYVKLGWLPLCALSLLAGCATTPTAAELLPVWSAPSTPSETADAFITAWNTGERPQVLATFEPTRRITIENAPLFKTRLDAWHAVQHVVPPQCNARGAFWKTAIVTFQDRRSGASTEEIVWIHLHDGGWWMYSL